MAVQDEARRVAVVLRGAAQQEVVSARAQAQAAAGQVGTGHPGLLAAAAHGPRTLFEHGQHVYGQPPPLGAYLRQ